MKQIKQIKCKKCPYYTGQQVQGHGEYWGYCTVIQQTKKMISIALNENNYDIELKHYESSWAEICDDNSECKIFEIRKTCQDKK